MALTKRTRFILVQSTSNSNVTEDNMEPYHISIFRRSTSMPPLPKLRSKKINNSQHEQQQQQSIGISKYQRYEKDETLTNKFYRLNIHTMKKKSARISMRLSSAFGLSAHTIDEQFNFQEQRFRAIEKFSKLFLRNIYLCVEALKESFITQVDIAEDFEELLIDKIPDLAQQFLRLKLLLLENTFTEFCNHIELYVVQSINTLIQLFIRPTNLIAKRHKKLLDYDSAQSAYEKVKDQQLKQAKQALNLSKETYELLNNQLLEELPLLYEYSCQIISICLKEFIHAHLYLIQQTRINIQIILNQIIPPVNFQQLNWQQIVDRFLAKNNSVAEKLNQLIITSKNFSEKTKNLSTTQLSSLINNLYNYDKKTYIQTNEIRNLLKNNYPEKDLFIVIQDYINNSCNNQSTNSKSDIIVRNGDIVLILNQYDKNKTNSNWFVDNGVTRGYLPRSILIPLLSNNQSEIISSTPPTPIRHDIPILSQNRLSLSHINSRLNYEQPRKTLTRAKTEPELCLINSTFHHIEDDNQPIYLNQLDYPSSTIEIDETHQYASIDSDDSIIPISNEQERIYIALYDFYCTIEGVLSIQIGERLKVLQHSDDDKNEEWWYVEKINDTRQRGYVPANYIQAI
ncbi:unnamed protein product [Rotaria sp. Silwood1]|nr:unnamed protein product [Rotaria sp. Silwood1]CAF1598283.1 unnamed protein product [Rotaria sp. Silwood1]CAF3718953.1 unnamed protein product [Rotaria sp. Silwood1]CAF4962919.1 unnamed protein product [Rotaria sp. Silwood1]